MIIPHEKFGPIFSRKEGEDHSVHCRVSELWQVLLHLTVHQTLQNTATRKRDPIYLVTGLSEKDAHFEGLGMWKIQLEAVPSLTLEHLRKVDADGDAPKDRQPCDI